MVNAFNVDMTTKLHRTMCHVKDHLLLHGFIRRGSAEKNEHENKNFKKRVNFINKHLETIGPQLLRARVRSDEVFHSEPDSDSEGDTMGDEFSTNISSLNSLLLQTMESVEFMNGVNSPKQISSSILAQTDF